MSGIGNTSVEIDIVANDQASGVVQSSTQNINNAWKSMRDQQRSVQREFELSNTKFVATSRVINAVGQGIGRMISIYNTFTLSQIRMQNAAQAVSDAQDRVNQALIDFGPDSEQYKKALKDQQNALDQQNQTTQQVEIGYGLMAVGVIADVTRMVNQVIPKLNMLRGAMSTVNTAGGTPGAMGPTIPFGSSTAGKLAKGAGIAGGAGLGIAGFLQSGAMNPNATDQDKLMSTLEMAGGGALAGLMVGGPIGALIGGGIGAGAGIASNYGQQLTQIFNINGPSADQVVKSATSAAKLAQNYG